MRPASTQGLTFHVNIPLPPGVDPSQVTIRLGPVEARVVPSPAPVYAPPPPAAPRRVEAPRVRTTAYGSVQGTVLELMRRGQLLQQQDLRLAQRGLLMPNGGLCATTSAVNALHAAFHHQGRDTSVFSQSDHLVHQLVEQAWHRHHRDARMGLDLGTLASVINDVANTLSRDVGVHARTAYPAAADASLLKLCSTKNALTILSVQTGHDKWHAITLLDVDTRNRTVTYSDPNHPNHTMVQRFWFDRSSIHFDGFNGYGRICDAIEVRVENYDPDPARRFRHFAGKRVRIFGSDGVGRLCSISRVDAPSPEYPRGRVVQGIGLLGSASSGTWTFDDITDIVEIPRPTDARIDALDKYVGQQVRVKFTEKYWNAQHGQKRFDVLRATRDVDLDVHPYGGLVVKASDEKWASEYVIPYEGIDSVSLVDARVDATRTSEATPKRRRPVL